MTNLFFEKFLLIIRKKTKIILIVSTAIVLNNCAVNQESLPLESDPLFQAINSGSENSPNQELIKNNQDPLDEDSFPSNQNFASKNPEETFQSEPKTSDRNGLPEVNNFQPTPVINPTDNKSKNIETSFENSSLSAPVNNLQTNLAPINSIENQAPPKQFLNFFNPFVAVQKPDYDFSQIDCTISEYDIKEIISALKRRGSEVIRTLPDCLKFNRNLMFQAAIIDPNNFQYAADILKEDESFVRRIIEVSPQVLKFTSASLRLDKNFMEEATYMNRNALEYADPKLLDNKIFMREMIKIDAKNYMFASKRLKEISEFAESAFIDDGLLLKYAPERIKSDKKLVTIAVKSNSEALQYADKKLQEDQMLKKLAKQKTSTVSEENLRKFLYKNYVNDSDKKNVGLIIDNRLKFFAKNKIIDRNYITKWQRSFEINNEDFHLIAADSRNYPISWKEDFKKFPILVKKIEKFLLNHQVDQNTIDNLSTVYFWKVKKNPQTVVFNLYLMRESQNENFGAEFVNVTSLTAIAQKHQENWDLSIVEVIFDSETKVDIAYDNGHKKYFLWDLYQINSVDKNPKIIFKIEDRFNNYFEIFEEQNNGKYRLIYKIDSLKDFLSEAKKERANLGDESSF